MNLFLSHHNLKIFTVILLFSAISLLTGCWDRREINDTALVLGAAIDKEKKGKIRITVQVLIPSTMSGGQQGVGGGGGESRVMVRSAVGDNIEDASSKLQLQFSRKIFWGHCKMYTIGETLAKTGSIHEQIDFLLRHPEPRERAYLFVSSGNASDIMKFKPTLELYMGEGLRKLSEMHIGVSATVKDFEQMLTNDADTAILPFIRASSTPYDKGGKKALLMHGTAIFKNGKMIGHIDAETTRGLLWFRNESEVTSITVHSKEGETISLDPIRQTTKLIPTIKNGKWSILAKSTLEGMIVQNESHLDVMSPQITKKIEKDMEKDIKNRMNLSLKQVKKEMNADTFGFADAFHRKYPKEWNKVKNHWDHILPQVNVNIDVKVRVRRPGLTTTPAGVKEKEVEKK